MSLCNGELNLKGKMNHLMIQFALDSAGMDFSFNLGLQKYGA